MAPGLGLLVFLLHLPYLWPGGPALRHTGFSLTFDHDEATVVYDAFRVALGEVAYRDFFNFKGPVFGLVYGGAFWLGGARWEVGQLVWIATHALAMGLLASLTRRLAGAGVACFAVAFHAFVLVLLWPRPYEQWLAELWVLLGAWLLIVPQTRSRAQLGAAGLSFGLAAATALSLGLPVALAALGLVALGGLETRPLRLRPGLHAAGWLGLGVMLGLGLALLPTALAGALPAFYEQTVLWPRRSYVASQPSVYASGKHGILAKLPELGPGLARLAARGALELVALLPLVLALGVGLFGLRFLASRWLGPVRASPRFVAVMLAGAFSAHLLVGGINRDMTHLAFVGGAALLGLAALVAALQERWPRARPAVSGTFGALGLGALLLYLHLAQLSWTPSRAEGSWREAALRRLGDPALAAELGPQDSMVYGGFAPGYVYFHVAPSALPITNFPLQPKAWVGYYDEAQYQWLARGVVEKRPKLMLLSGYQWSYLVELRPELQALYEPVPGRQYGWLALWRLVSAPP